MAGDPTWKSQGKGRGKKKSGPDVEVGYFGLGWGTG
ncbi:hypothetical protein COLO4_31432 [Corchorus olitorius]|uniref:Uncharacterized protein n=1 Tax=Corchorus olitorius TaxID=93759 RepID=A0A1R3H4D0_9ROSI|nr:hypothetical protein COLO4_31432 [Corchorus olitorius]